MGNGSQERRELRAVFAQPSEQNLPPFTVPTQEDRVREAVTGNMLLRHPVPAAMDNRDPRFCADRLEDDLDLRLLARPEGRLTPTEDKPFARLPHPDAADLEDGAVRQCLGEASAFTGLEGKRAGRARCKPEQRVRRPPQRDVARENLEGTRRRSLDAHGHKNLRCHDTRST